MRQRTPDRVKGQAVDPQAPRISTFTAWTVSCLLVSTITICCVVGRPYVIDLMREAHVDGDADVGRNSVWHRQRQFVSAEEEVEMLKLLLAQKEEGVEEDQDADFVTSYQRVIPEGYIKVDDYDDDENDYSEVTKSDEKVQGRRSLGRAGANNPPSRRSFREVIVPTTTLMEGQAPPRPTRRIAADDRGSSSFSYARDQRRIAELARFGKYGLRRRSASGVAGNARVSGNPASGATESSTSEEARPPLSSETSNASTSNTSAITSNAAASSEGVTFVPMLEGAFDLQSVESKGRHYGYMSNEGPVKVLENPKWKLRKNKTWMQPQSVCPGKPTKKGLAAGSPPKKHQAAMMKAIDYMAEGKYQEESDGVRYLVENRCLFLTRDCAQLNLTYGGPAAVRSLKTTEEEFEKLRTEKLIDLKPRSLGSCALVANSENLLSGARGAEIDAHDTIFRHNTPVKGFEKAVGKRPTSVMWVKAKYMKKAAAAGQAELMYDLLVGLDRLPKTFTHRGKSLMIVNKSGGGNKFIRERGQWYKMAGASAKNHPSGGFARPLAILASGLCTRVDLYGFSSKPSGKYFERSFKVLDTHMMGFEHWVYRYLQSKGKLCVYGE